LGSISYLNFVGILFDPVNFFIMLDLFPIYFFPKGLSFVFDWRNFHIGIFLPEQVLEFLAVCSKHFILIVLVLRLRWCFLFKLFHHSL
jgi:hypothetical protein